MAHNEVALKKVDAFLISKNDEREYRYLQLPNGLRVTVISDPTTDKSAAAVSVEVGSFADPEELPGLAHFLEHLLFLGSVPYPGENQYSEFLAEHGGYSNAYTAAEETNYHFEVAPEALEGALAIFSQFFISPLFTPGGTSRELKAVDAEHAKNIQNDMWRLYQLDKSTSKAGHPYTKFGTGDSRTLQDIPAAKGIDVRAALLAFHAQHYSSNRMSLVIYGKEDVETLSAWATKMFADVNNNGSTPPLVPGHPRDGCNGILQHVVPIKDQRSLNICWALPELRTQYKSKSGGYLSHLLGHEGPGSLLAHLKAAGWASGLSAGPDTTSGYGDFNVSIELSEGGLGQVDNILALVYAYVGLLRSKGVQPWVYEELAAQAAASYRFLSKGRPMNTAVGAARNMHQYPTEHTFCGGSLYWEFQPQLVHALLGLFTPENSRVALISKTFADKCVLSEPWYGTKYTSAPLEPALLAICHATAEAYRALSESRPVGTAADAPELLVEEGSEVAAGIPLATGSDPSAWLAALRPALLLPAPNDFIATDFTLSNPVLKAKQEAAEAAGRVFVGGLRDTSVGEGEVTPRREPVPVLLRDDARSSLWWHQDDFFAVPKTYLHAEVMLPACYWSPKTFVLTDLYTHILEQSLTEFAYAADLAELRYNITLSVQGFQLRLGGFSHRAASLAAKIAQRIVGLKVTPTAFALQKDKVLRSYQDFNMEQPIQHALYAASMATCTPKWHNDDKIAAVTGVTLEDLTQFQATLLQQAYFKCLVDGNADEAGATALAEALLGPIVAASTPLSTSQHVDVHITALPLPITLHSGGGKGLLAALTTRTHSVVVNFDWVYSFPSRNPGDPNAAMDYILQVGPTQVGAQPEEGAMLHLIEHLISEPFFDSLRTKQALGYVVASRRRIEGSVEGLSLLIQSNKVTAAELVKRTETFLFEFDTRLRTMPADKFKANVSAVVSRINESDKNLWEESASLFGYIQTGLLDFRRAKHLTAALAKVSKGEVLEWYRSRILPGGSRRRAFISLVEAPEHPTTTTTSSAASVEGEGEGESESEEDEAGPLSPETEGSPPAGGTVVAGDGTLAREDALAPPAAASAVVEEPLPLHHYTAASDFAEMRLTAAQAAVIAARVGCDGSEAAAFHAFAMVGADLKGFVEGKGSGGSPPAGVRVRVDITHHDQVRGPLPTFTVAGRTYMDAWRGGFLKA